MKASKAQSQINKQTKAILNILTFMLRKGDMEDEQIQKIMAGDMVLNLEPIAPTKKPKRTAAEVSVDQSEQKESVPKPDSRDMSKPVIGVADFSQTDNEGNSGEPNPLPEITNSVIEAMDDQIQV